MRITTEQMVRNPEWSACRGGVLTKGWGREELATPIGALVLREAGRRCGGIVLDLDVDLTYLDSGRALAPSCRARSSAAAF
jgi:hypothetical protein